jgi:peptide/nickel transport system substrate-binding protein
MMRSCACSRISCRIGLIALVTCFVLTLFSGKVSAANAFRVGVGIDPDTLDPAQLTTTTVANMVDYIVEPLVTIDQEGNLQPLLAERWDMSGDGLQYTFQLRTGVTFHDGSPFTAEAVKWNLDRLLDPDVRVPIRAPFLPIGQVEAVDPATLKIALKHPSAPFLSVLSLAGILSPAAVSQFGNDYKNYQHPVGTGPYLFRERKKGESITVTLNTAYWGPRPFYDTVVFRIVPEAATRESLLLAGQVDLIILPPVSDLPALERNPATKVLMAPSDRTIFIAANTLKPPLNDPRMRQALNYAVDKVTIVKHVLFGAADVMDAPLAPSLFGYCQVGAYEYDPAKAKALLAQASVPAGTKLQLLTPTGRYVQDFQATQAIAGFLRDIGLQVDVQTMDWPSYIATINAPPDKNTTQLHLLGWAPAFLDASQQMLQFLSSYAPPHGLATTFYKDPEVDQLIQAAERELDPDRRKALYCQISQRVWTDAPWIFLWVQRFPIVYSSKVTGVSSRPNEKFYALYARPTQ